MKKAAQAPAPASPETRYLWFLRHGRADWPAWGGADDDRPLTKKGRREVRSVMKLCQRLPHRPSIILTSPLPRAAETAEVAAAELAIELRKTSQLAPGFVADSLRKLLGKIEGGSVLLVGHEPDFSTAVADLTGARIKMPKAGLAVVKWSSAEATGTLISLLPPSLAKRIDP